MTDQIIDLAKAFFNQGAVEIGSIERMLGRKGAVDATVSNPSFQVYQFAGSGLEPVKSIEVRVRRATGRSKILMMEIDTRKHCLKEKDIRAAFGPLQDLLPPPGRHAGKVPTYLVYKYQQGELRFGMQQSNGECCVNVVVDFNV